MADAQADDLLDRVVRILDREVGRLEQKDALTAREIGLLIRVADAAREVVALQLDPLGASGRRKLQAMSDEQLEALRLRLEGQPHA